MDIPKNAKLVFSWEKFDIYQWDQIMFDWTFQIFEWIKRKDVVQVIPYDWEKIYLLYEEQPWKKPYYSLIGWELEKNENDIDGAIRELKEETWFVTDKLFPLKKFSPCSLMEWNIIIYVTNSFKKTNFRNLDKWEKNEIIEVNINEFIDIVLSDNFSWKVFANFLCWFLSKFWKEKLKDFLLFK